MTFMLYEKQSVPLSESDKAWYDLIKTEFSIYMQKNEGPWDLPDFFSNTLCITHHKYQSQSEKETLWNAKDHIVRDMCPIEVIVPRFRVQFFNGKFYQERIKLVLDGVDDNKNFVFATEQAGNGDYRLYLSDINVAILLRIAHGFEIIDHRTKIFITMP